MSAGGRAPHGLSPAALRAIAAQALLLGAIVALLLWLGASTVHNLEQRKVHTGFRFLLEAARIPLSGDALIDYDPESSSYGRVILIGVLNTAALSLAVIVLATVAGTALGLARLSPNWLASRLALAYVEIVRNIPSLLIVLFAVGLLSRLGGPREALKLPLDSFLSNRGLVFPRFTAGEGLAWLVLVVLAGVALTTSRAARLRERGGPRASRRAWFAGLGATAIAAVAAWTALALKFDYAPPALRGFNFEGGHVMSLECSAMVLALTVYFAAYVAETVRAGVLSVPRGQWDAARALGLSRAVTLRLVVLPQALRIMVPPMANTYSGIVKATSLGVAIGYQELVSVTNSMLSSTGQAIELVSIVMIVYFAINAAIGVAAGWLNTRLLRVDHR
jgi:general L-amino acid transport system permease protein